MTTTICDSVWMCSPVNSVNAINKCCLWINKIKEYNFDKSSKKRNNKKKI